MILIPILKPGFFSIHDETHIVDVYQMIRSIEVNGFPPRFIPDVNFGLGHPYFNFYYHLPFYVTSLFYYIGFSMVDSFKYMMGLSVVVAAGGFYLFLRNHVTKLSSAIGTLVYILSPYFAVDLYVRGAFGELFILALFPWAGFLLRNYLNKANTLNLGFAAISIGLLSISHNVLLPFIYSLLLLYGLVNLVILKSKPWDYLKLFLPFFLGVALASYYLIPAFLEVQFISTYEQFNLADHFPFIKQLFIPHWGYGPSIWGPLDDISFDIGTVNLSLLLISFAIYKFAKKEFKILLIFFWLTFGLAFILTNNRTLFFWESIRFLRLVQFPWRMLLIIIISTSFIAAIATETLSEKLSKKNSSIFFLAILICLLVLNFWHYQPSEFKNTTDEEYLERYFANRTLKGQRGYVSYEYLNFSEDFIPPTIWQKVRPKNILEEVSFAKGSGKLDVQTSGLSYNIAYQTPVEDKIIIAKTFFPGWEAEGNSGKLVVEPFSDYGIIAVRVQEGSGNFTLSFKDTPIRLTSNMISAVTAAIILVLLIYPYIRRFK